MTMPVQFLILDDNIYIDCFTRVYDSNKKPIRCKHYDKKNGLCRTHLEWSPNIGFHCSDNLLHKVDGSGVSGDIKWDCN